MWEMQIMQEAIICQRPVEEVIETIPDYQFDQRISW
jgi:hypothetical protein